MEPVADLETVKEAMIPNVAFVLPPQVSEFHPETVRAGALRGRSQTRKKDEARSEDAHPPTDGDKEQAPEGKVKKKRKGRLGICFFCVMYLVISTSPHFLC